LLDRDWLTAIARWVDLLFEGAKPFASMVCNLGPMFAQLKMLPYLSSHFQVRAFLWIFPVILLGKNTSQILAVSLVDFFERVAPRPSQKNQQHI
jgi:hypothetical protein